MTWLIFGILAIKKLQNVSATFFYNAANAMPGILTTTRPQYTGERSRREGARKLCHLSRALVAMSKSVRFITQQWTLNHIITCLSKTTWWPHIIMQALLLPWPQLPDEIILLVKARLPAAVQENEPALPRRVPFEIFRYMRERVGDFICWSIYPIQ